ncbi:BolA family protein [Bombella apis]|uniref:BolA family protein n=1 Tax=Bombella apis TaxID=1785988 RepID=UPI0024A84397|nr:BolA family protein [Bombella apis]
MKRVDRMRAVLEEALSPSILEIRDDSARHRHHAAMRTQAQESRGPEQVGETHYHLHVVSRRFDGMKTLARHRLVNDLLAGEFQTGLHALSLSLEGENQP